MRYLVLSVVLAAGCVRLPPPRHPLDALSAEEQYKLGAAYEAEGENDAAVARYRAAVNRDKHYAPAWLALGNRAFASGAFADAETYFRKSLENSPADASASNNLAMTYLARSKRLAEAESLLRDALAKGGDGPLRPYMLDTLANLYLKEKRWDEARVAVDAGIESAKNADKRVQEKLTMTRSSLDAAIARE
jgi:tetratricopeptide (TPR) repeat protein